MAFKDYTEFSAGPLRLPYAGKTYTLPEVSIALGVRLTTELRDEDSPFTRLAVEEAWSLLLGDDVLAAMKADGVPAAFVNRCFLTALSDFKYGRDAAEATWEAGLDPKALAEFAAARMAETLEDLPESAA